MVLEMGENDFLNSDLYSDASSAAGDSVVSDVTRSSATGGSKSPGSIRTRVSGCVKCFVLTRRA